MCTNETLFCLPCLYEDCQSYNADFCILCDVICMGHGFLSFLGLWLAQLYYCFYLLYCHGQTNLSGCYFNLPRQS